MRPFSRYLRKSSFGAAPRLSLGALLASAVLVGSAAPAGAAETYRGSDPESYECSSDYQILNRFSAPPGVSAARSTKYADIKFTLKNNVISVKDASNLKDLAYIAVGENTKYCAYKDVQIIKKRRDPKFMDPRLYPQACNIDYHEFRMRIVVDAELPVRAFSLHGPPEFDKMDHLVDVYVDRAADRRKKNSAAGCNEIGDSPDSHFFGISNIGLRTASKSALNLIEEAPYRLKNGDSYSVYEREALKKAGREIPRPK